MQVRKRFTMRRTRAALIAVAVGVATLASACGGAGNAGGGDGTYKIGALLGLTGSYAALGEQSQKAINLYVEKINAAGGINGRKLEVVFADTTSSESEAVNQLRKLVTQDKVLAVVGPNSSGESIAVKPISLSLRTPVIALASSDSIITPADQAKYIFKHFPSTEDSLRAQLEYAKSQSWTKVAILAANNGYGQEPLRLLPKVINEYGLQLVASETFPPNATDMSAQLSSIARTQPDVLLVWAVNPANAIVAKNAKDIGFKAKLFHSPGGGTPLYVQTAKGSTEDTLVQGSKIAAPDQIEPSDRQYKVIQDFVSAYRSKYGSLPDQFASNGWDGMTLITAALEKAQVNPGNVQQARDKLRESLENNIKDFAGVNAIYSFNADWHGPRGIEGLAVLGVRDQKFTLVKAY